MRENQTPENTVAQILADSSPLGTIHLSPALQRGVKWNETQKSGGTTQFSCTLFQRCGNRNAFNAASQFAEKLDFGLAFGWRSGLPLR